ncbi:cytokine receptor common subunit beta [Alligator mississippiensis]|nr:cytokine receptor common subunit beta [Alligator mississippiensis]XP_059582404.1 cytokine receptor common subunit beta [Alligator mississippiensis]
MRDFCMVVLALCLASVVGEEQVTESIPMKSLHCYNDYASQTTCMWEECSKAHHFLNMTLFHKDSCTPNSKEMPCESQRAGERTDCQSSPMQWVCHRKSSCFAIGIKDIYSFKPDRLLQAELNVTLFQNVQPLPPQKLSIHERIADNFLLVWEAAGGINGSPLQDDSLEYEVAYKRDWESWEISSSVLVSNTSKHLFSHDSLVPGSTYVARVRAKPSQKSNFTGQYSAWSTEVSWETQAGDDGQPKNLRCHFNGVDHLLCSWEVRQEVTSSVLFTLFYKVTQTSEEKECSPVHEKRLPDIPYVFQSCEINISNPNHVSWYHVTVRHKKEEKSIEACKHIKVLAPTNLTVTTKEDQEYELRWVKHKLQYGFIKQSYQVLYWKADQSSEAAKSINISNDEPPFIFPSQMLKSSTRYRAKMRARVHASSDYDGPWSEWSEECTWETEHVGSPVVVPLLVSFGITMLVVVGWYSSQCFLSKKKKWEEKIPNPSKSQLVQGFFQKGPLGSSSLWDFSKPSSSEKMEQASNLQVLDGVVKFVSAGSLGAEAPKMDPENWYHISEVPGPTPLSAALCDWQSSQRTSQFLSPAPFACVGGAEVDTTSLVPMSFCDFNGPYLYCAYGNSLAHTQEDLGAAPEGIRKESISVDYVSLPQECCTQASMVGAETRANFLQSPWVSDQKEMKQIVAGGQDVLQDLPADEEGVKEEREGQGSPTVVPINSSSQKWPLEYITTEGLCLVPAEDSVNLSPALDPQEQMLNNAGTLTYDSQLPQTVDDTFSPALLSGRFGVSLPVAAQAPATPPGSQHPELDSNMTLPLTPQGSPKPISLSPSASLEGGELSQEEPVHENNLVVFNPDGTDPVFLHQVGEYCFFPNPSKKISKNQQSSLASKPPKASEIVGKTACDGKSVHSKPEDGLHMQAIQLFKALKSDDYFASPLWDGQQHTSRAREFC